MSDNKTLVVNLFGGPGTGKSSMMASIFSALKWKGINCEMAPEFAKEKVWENSLGVLDDQIYIFGKQNHKIRRLVSQVDVIITDSPLILSLMYGEDESDAFKQLVVETHMCYDHSLNIFLGRVKPYNPKGRIQTEEKARELDDKIKEIMESIEEDYETYPAGPESVDAIVDRVLTHVRENVDNG